MTNTLMGSVWYLDSGVSLHMIGCKEFSSSVEEKDLQMHIEMGDGGRYNATGTNTVTFEREKASPLHIKYVIFVPTLNNNLIFVAVLESCGYDVIFSKGKSFLRHITTNKVN